MINYRLLLLFSLLLFGTPLKGQFSTAELENAIRVFFVNYDVQIPVYLEVSFYKKGDILYVERREFSLQRLESEPFYDYANQSFLPISFFEKRTDGDTIKTANLTASEIQLANRSFAAFKDFSRLLFKDAQLFPFFGYRGYYQDVIDFYQDKNNLTADELHALARAHGNKLGYQFQTAKFDNLLEEHVLHVGEDSFLTDQQLATFFKLLEGTKNAYRQLKEQFPDYQTPVGKASVKYANEVILGYLLLSVYAEHGIAPTVLEANLYSDSTIREARKILESCPKNSVLITNGDHATYPLFYVQAYEQYRTDLILLNWDLAILPRFVKAAYQGPLDAKPLKSHIPSKMLDGINVLQMERRGNNSLDLPHLFRFIADNEFEANITGSKNLFCPLSTLSIQFPGKCPERQQNISLPWYVFLSEMVQLDILYANNWKRPLCFTKSPLKNDRFFLKPFAKETAHIYYIDKDQFCQ
ncbi:MAG: hypothetical protein AAF598_11920 [Bacteroidota bacterium]